MLLSGRDIAEYIQQRHYSQVRSLGYTPKLIDIHASSDPNTETYLKAKSRYAAAIGVAFEVVRPVAKSSAILAQVKRLNDDGSVHGIIVQLPLPSTVNVNQIVESIKPVKDVDGMGPKAAYDPATPTGILWLLAGYNIDYKGKVVTVVGQGRLVGAPLSRLLADSGAIVIKCDINTQNLAAETLKADIIVTASGQAGLIRPGMVKPGAVVIDASGDVDSQLLDDKSLKITPPRGGVGPMTVAALFDNLIRAAQ